MGGLGEDEGEPLGDGVGEDGDGDGDGLDTTNRVTVLPRGTVCPRCGRWLTTVPSGTPWSVTGTVRNDSPAFWSVPSAICTFCPTTSGTATPLGVTDSVTVLP